MLSGRFSVSSSSTLSTALMSVPKAVGLAVEGSLVEEGPEVTGVASKGPADEGPPEVGSPDEGSSDELPWDGSS